MGVTMPKLPIRPAVVPTCPICGKPISLSAVSETMDFNGSGFWGDPGFRSIVCTAGAHMHFQIIDPQTGETAERYAFLVPRSVRSNEGSHD